MLIRDAPPYNPQESSFPARQLNCDGLGQRPMGASEMNSVESKFVSSHVLAKIKPPVGASAGTVMSTARWPHEPTVLVPHQPLQPK